ncbi:cellulose biosynthesis cyclic di-GMP-binding regulatory protein BcsB [Leeuwenhoekiella parthenopeia]|uniref:Cellulose biosynthesis cyclic di-GMP-binding regulatory protein BcsB n=1 Tax=Leeuwenhoekiella parthenopeia TaxID=2890320 RepID=A0ABS8GY45_9FLAO|nr:cellulose biosynthesis cyclic di-GMP-binding regulatory protein BcsB [Leeuwenhoekiella parthenopeia]MCC4214423.1 cellulose biosynthesis cyclic di-GMP-binding regulatory protein BcsB [Leeuwenhoekiella parthenopeia]
MKKKQIGFTVLALLSILNVFAQVTLDFTEFNYPEETITWGSHTKMTYFIPVDRTKLLKNNSIHLDFKTSEVLTREKSFITLVIADTPRATKSPDGDDYTVSFTEAFGAKDVVSGFLKIEILNNLSITDDICEIYNEGAFWIRRLNSSYISLDYDQSYITPNTISEFIPRVERLFIPENPSFEELNYAAYTQFFFKREWGKELQIEYIPQSFDTIQANSITLGKIENLPLGIKESVPADLKSKGLIKLLTLSKSGSDAKPNENELIQTLLVTGADLKGFFKAAQSLLAKEITQSAFSTTYLVNEGMDMSYKRPSADRKLNFKQLGVIDEITEGIGKLSKEFTLSRSVYGADLSELTMQLSFTYRPLKENENAYVNIYLNDELELSEALNSTGKFERIVNFENLNLGKNSQFRVEYYYVPAGGLCIKNPILFYAQINLERSFVQAAGYRENKDLDFYYYPEILSTNHPAAIYLDMPYQKDHIPALSKLIGSINPIDNGNSYLYPRIMPADSLKLDEKKYSPIIISSKSGSLTQFNASTENFTLEGNQFNFEKTDYTRYFNISYTDELGVSQLFTKNDVKGLFMFVPEGKASILNFLVEKLKEQGSQSRGDLILASDSEAFVFDLNTLNSQANKEEIQSNFDVFWLNYRVFVIFALFVMMVVTLIYIFQKSQQSKKNIVNEN